MGLKRLVKKSGKLVKKSLKFQKKLVLAPLKFAKKHPTETLAVLGATFTGGASLGALGADFAKKALNKKLKLGEDVGETVATEPGFSNEYPPPPMEQAPEEFPGGLPKGMLIVGGVLLVALLLVPTLKK